MDGSTGTVTIEGDPDPATGKIAGVITYADGTTAWVNVDADTGAAESEIANLTKPRNDESSTCITEASGRRRRAVRATVP